MGTNVNAGVMTEHMCESMWTCAMTGKPMFGILFKMFGEQEKRQTLTQLECKSNRGV